MFENYTRFNSTTECIDQPKKVSIIEEKPQNGTPPVSPSYLSASNMEDGLFTTRSSSLNRTTSSSSTTAQRIPLSPKFLLSAPTSPLTFGMSAVYESNQGIFPNFALLSFISNQFIVCVKSLNERRKIFSSAEYPLSFTGEEAVVCCMKNSGCNEALTIFFFHRILFAHFCLVDRQIQLT